jgi:hypothetical protein
MVARREARISMLSHTRPPEASSHVQYHVSNISTRSPPPSKSPTNGCRAAAVACRSFTHKFLFADPPRPSAVGGAASCRGRLPGHDVYR